jgi:hypothetical protein
MILFTWKNLFLKREPSDKTAANIGFAAMLADE